MPLDARYLEFRERTAAVFAAYPQLEPLRYWIFKDLVVRRRQVTEWDRLKHWLRPLRFRRRTRRPDRVDALLWVESPREMIAEAIVPLYRELRARDLRVALVSLEGPDGVPREATRFHARHRGRLPAWAASAWDALCETTRELRATGQARLFGYYCAAVQALLDEVHRILDAAGPRVAVAASTQAAGGAALMVACRSRGGASLLLQHGILQPFFTPVLADRFLTWGPSSTDILQSLGVPSTQVLTVGSPRHDRMAPGPDGAARARLRRTEALGPAPVFVFFSNGNDLLRNGEAPRECARWLEAVAAEQAGRLTVVVRLHPNENGALYRDCPHLHLARGRLDLHTLLDGCDWAGSLCSTVLYDALLYRKPVWHFHAEGWPPLADNWQRGLAWRVASRDQLRALVRQQLAGGAPQPHDERVVTQVFANYPHATAAAADVVEGALSR